MWKYLLIKEWDQSEMALKKANTILNYIRGNSYSDLNINAIEWGDKISFGIFFQLIFPEQDLWIRTCSVKGYYDNWTREKPFAQEKVSSSASWEQLVSEVVYLK